MSDFSGIALAVVLLLANGFFVGAEFAVISARRTQIEPLADSGSAAARVTLRAMEQVSLMLAGAQLGITVCSLGLGAVGEPAVAHVLEGPFEALGIPASLRHALSFAIALSIVVFLHMLVGEMIPKNAALSQPERAALLLGPLLYWFVWPIRPLIWVLNSASNGVLRLLRVPIKGEVASAFTREEVADLIAESGREGLLRPAQRERVQGALEFTTQTLADVAQPAADFRAIAPDTTIGELEDLAIETGFSRFPMRTPAGEFLGYCHVKDLVDSPADRLREPIPRAAVRTMTTISGDANLRDAAVAMAAHGSGSHLAVVKTEGQPDALVTLDDVVSELIGEIRQGAAGD
ncbi:MAG: Magnesium and cobalt efflux protein CorC [Actinomycetota bacterium]